MAPLLQFGSSSLDALYSRMVIAILHFPNAEQLPFPFTLGLRWRINPRIL